MLAVHLRSMYGHCELQPLFEALREVGLGFQERIQRFVQSSCMISVAFARCNTLNTNDIQEAQEFGQWDIACLTVDKA